MVDDLIVADAINVGRMIWGIWRLKVFQVGRASKCITHQSR